VLATPGHSKGSLTFYFPDAKAAFVGDLIFFRSIGRTDFEGATYTRCDRLEGDRIRHELSRMAGGGEQGDALAEKLCR
jgi:glyoxylase-like metal-dependent hydrolase (beta-lactamase superfamily II)